MYADDRENTEESLPRRFSGSNQESRPSKTLAEIPFGIRKAIDSTFPNDEANCSKEAKNTSFPVDHLSDKTQSELVITNVWCAENKHHQTNSINTFRKVKDRDLPEENRGNRDRLPVLAQDTNESNNKDRQSFNTQPVRHDDQLTFPAIGPSYGSTPHLSSKPQRYKSKDVNEELQLFHLPHLETGAEWMGSNNENIRFHGDSSRIALDANHNKFLKSNIPTKNDLSQRRSSRLGSLDRSNSKEVQKCRTHNIKEKILTVISKPMPARVKNILHSRDDKLAFLPGIPGKRTGTNAFNAFAKYTGPTGSPLTHTPAPTPMEDENKEITETDDSLSSPSMEPYLKAADISNRINSYVLSEKIDVLKQDSFDRQVRFSGNIPHYTIKFTVREVSVGDRPYLKVKYNRAKGMIRFELPTDLALLENKTPLFYLTHYTKLDEEIKASFTRTFNKFKGPQRTSTTLKEHNFFRAINSLLADDLKYQNYELIEKFILKPERNTRTNEKLKLGLNGFLGLCAFCERRFWSEFFPLNYLDSDVGCCPFLEYLDFRDLDLKLMAFYEKLSPPLIIVLKSLA